MTVVNTRDLDTLAIVINTEHAACEQSAVDAVQHAVNCGLALLDARAVVPDGEWGPWCTAHLRVGMAMVRVYMNIAEHRELIRGSRSTSEARRILRALAPGGGLTTGRTRRGKHIPDEKKSPLVKEAKRLHAQGRSYREIGIELDVARGTVQYWLDPAYGRRNVERERARKKEQREARAALERERRSQAVKAHGGPTADAYALLRRAALRVDEAIGGGVDAATKAALRDALSAIHKAEDGIVRALRLERTGP